MMNISKFNILGAVFLVLLVTVLILSVYHKEPSDKVVLLSFDVEPVDGESVLDIMEVLDKTEVGATFFVTGKYAVEYPEIVKKLSENIEFGDIHHEK